MSVNQRKAREQIIVVGRRLYEAGLAVAKSGNISCRLNDNEILITASGSFLGSLSVKDIVKVDLSNAQRKNNASSELPLHKLVYENFPSNTVIHCHPPLINGYFAVNDSLEIFTFETKFYLGNVPVIKQDTPTVTKPNEVIDALKDNNLVVLKNHGAVVIADTFRDGLALIEALEEAVKTAVVARLFGNNAKQSTEEVSCSKESRPEDKAYPMFSAEHIKAIVDLVNNDKFILEKGKELNLTLELAVKLDDTNQAYKFVFEKGKIVKLESNTDAPFVISAPRDIWQQVFLGKLDSFVAVTQGKMKLDGQLGQLSKWYVPFTRLFQLFKEVKFK